MQNDLRKHIGLALLRIAPSALMLSHGIPKFQSLISGEEIQFADPIGIGMAPSLFLTVIAEVVCPLLMIVGFKTRWAAIPAAITMAVAAFIVHGADPLQKKELALIYLIVFVAVSLLGPGKFSIDRK